MTLTEVKEISHDQILAMEPGPELDALVAVRRMGWSELGPCWILKPTGVKYKRDWSPSTDIVAAMEVWDTLGADNAGQYLCKSDDGWSLMLPKRGEREPIFSAAPTATLAICRAALLTTLD